MSVVFAVGDGLGTDSRIELIKVRSGLAAEPFCYVGIRIAGDLRCSMSQSMLNLFNRCSLL